MESMNISLTQPLPSRKVLHDQFVAQQVRSMCTGEDSVLLQQPSIVEKLANGGYTKRLTVALVVLALAAAFVNLAHVGVP